MDQRYWLPSLVCFVRASHTHIVLEPGCLNAEAAFPLNILLTLGLSTFVRGEQANFDIDPAVGVEATQLYPDVATQPSPRSLV